MNQLIEKTASNLSNLMSQAELDHSKKCLAYHFKELSYERVEPFVGENEYSINDFIKSLMYQTGFDELASYDYEEEFSKEKDELAGYISFSITKLIVLLFGQLDKIEWRYDYSLGLCKDDLGFGLCLRLYKPQKTLEFKDGFEILVKEILESEFEVKSSNLTQYVTYELRFKESRLLKEMFNTNIPNFFYQTYNLFENKKHFSGLFNMTSSINEDGSYNLLGARSFI